MSNEQENFEKLRLLLSIKRYEQPPPGYFDRLSRDIIARIRAGEANSAIPIHERLGWDASWLQRIWSVLDAKPVLAGTLGLAVCGLALAGLAFNIAPETEPVSGMPIEQVLAGNLPPVGGQMIPASVVGLSVVGNPPIFASTGSVMSLAPQSAMPQARHPYAMPVSTGFR